MRMTKKASPAIVLVVWASLALGQRGGTMHIGYRAPAKATDQAIQATDDQRMAVVKCLQAADQVRLVTHQMPLIGNPWSRSRLSYTAGDVSTLSRLSGQFEESFTDSTAAHQELKKELTDAQRSKFERRLRKLEHLQVELKSEVSELNRDLAKAKPGPASPNIAWDVSSIKRLADRWRAEHRKIAKEMGVHV